MAEASFSLEVPEKIQVSGGQSNTTTVQVNKSPGRPKTVALSAIDIPVGIAVDFLPERGRPNFQSRLTVTATPALADGEYLIYVRGTDGEIVRSMPITIVKAGLANPQPPVSAPVLSSLSPSSVTEDTGSFTLQINGTGFVSGATAFWNGSSRSTSFVNSTRIDATILAGDITTPGTASVTATNPSSVPSNALTFTINAAGFTADVWVAKAGDGGSDSNNGLSEGAPKLTIGAGLGVLSSFGNNASKVMAIKNGTYSELIDSSSGLPSGSNFTNAATIRAYPAHTVILRAINLTTSSLGYLKFQDLTFDGGLAGNENVVSGQGGCHHIRLTNCICKNAQGQNIILGTSTTSNWEFINCESFGAGQKGLFDFEYHGIYITSSNNLIDGGLWHDNGYGMGVQFNPSSGEGGNIVRNARFYNNDFNYTPGRQGLVVWNSDNNIIYNCLIYDNHGVGIRLGGGASGNLLYNNSTYNNDSGVGIYNESGTNTATNCCCPDSIGVGGGTLNQTTNFQSDPSYQNPSGGDFHLTAGSSNTVRNGGTDLGSPYNVDFEGTARPQGTGWSIGAYERA